MATLELRGISKSYGRVQALTDVDLDVEAGEVRSLLGENGAGKSTLMKTIAGSVVPDAGTMALDGVPVPFGEPSVAKRRGIGIVYQELSLVPTLSVGENVLLGRWGTSDRRFVDVARTEREARPFLERIGLDVDPGMRVDRLGVAERQLVEIAKALSADVRLLLLDEPTSALSDRESRQLFRVIRDLSRDGVGIVYVSHHLPEVLDISDTITVMRDGRNVGSIDVAEADEQVLARRMVGREVTVEDEDEVGTGARRERAAGEVVLRARGLAAPPRLKPVDLDLHAGEIVTVFGLVGAGRTRLARALFGVDRPSRGTLEVFGEPLAARGPADAIAAGIGFVGDDRAAGLVPRMSVAQNITLASFRGLGRGPVTDRSRERELAERYVAELNIRTPSVDQPVDALSGGNQQKVLLARWLCSGARILLLDDPVRGVDVGAKDEVFRLVRSLAADGVAVLYLTSEIREARMLGDRVLVMAKGGIAGAFPPETSEDQIMVAAGGVHV